MKRLIGLFVLAGASIVALAPQAKADEVVVVHHRRHYYHHHHHHHHTVVIYHQ